MCGKIHTFQTDRALLLMLGYDLFGLYVTRAVFSKEGNGLVAVILS